MQSTSPKAGERTRYDISLEKQIARCIADKKSPDYFDGLAERAEADAAAMSYGNKGAQTREARRCRSVAAALRAHATT